MTAFRMENVLKINNRVYPWRPKICKCLCYESNLGQQNIAGYKHI